MTRKKRLVFRCKSCQKTKTAPSGVKKRVFCSVDCQKKYTKKKNKKACLHCKADYDSSRGGKFFCSRSCMYSFHGETSIEKKVGELLKQHELRFRRHANPLKRFTFPDFFLPKHDLVIYTDGDYWHSKTKEKDRVQDKVLRAYGLKVLRLTEKEINEDIRASERKILKRLKA